MLHTKRYIFASREPRPNVLCMTLRIEGFGPQSGYTSQAYEQNPLGLMPLGSETPCEDPKAWPPREQDLPSKLPKFIDSQCGLGGTETRLWGLILFPRRPTTPRGYLQWVGSISALQGCTCTAGGVKPFYPLMTPLRLVSYGSPLRHQRPESFYK